MASNKSSQEERNYMYADRGNIVDAVAELLSSEERLRDNARPSSKYSCVAELDEQEDAMSDLSLDEKKLLLELIRLFDIEIIYDRDRSKNKVQIETQKQQDVKRAREIIEELQLNVNFKALPYGHTFLSTAVENYSVDMAKMLLEKGADVNNEDTMDGATAIDKILEYEEEGQKLSDDMKEMKNLLLSKGAKTYKERKDQIIQMAIEARAEE